MRIPTTEQLLTNYFRSNALQRAPTAQPGDMIAAKDLVRELALSILRNKGDIPKEPKKFATAFEQALGEIPSESCVKIRELLANSYPFSNNGLEFNTLIIKHSQGIEGATLLKTIIHKYLEIKSSFDRRGHTEWSLFKSFIRSFPPAEIAEYLCSVNVKEKNLEKTVFKLAMCAVLDRSDNFGFSLSSLEYELNKLSQRTLPNPQHTLTTLYLYFTKKGIYHLNDIERFKIFAKTTLEKEPLANWPEREEIKAWIGL